MQNSSVESGGLVEIARQGADSAGEEKGDEPGPAPDALHDHCDRDVFRFGEPIRVDAEDRVEQAAFVKGFVKHNPHNGRGRESGKQQQEEEQRPQPAGALLDQQSQQQRQRHHGEQRKQQIARRVPAGHGKQFIAENLLVVSAAEASLQSAQQRHQPEHGKEQNKGGEQKPRAAGRSHVVPLGWQVRELKTRASAFDRCPLPA